MVMVVGSGGTMLKHLASGALLAAAVAGSSASAEVSAFADGLGAFLDDVRHGELRTPQRYTTQLPLITSRDKRRAVAPELDVVAGRLDARTCLYQLRLGLEWSGKALDEDDAAVGGRTLIQQAPCATLVNEVVAVAIYEISTLERRLHQGGRFAMNRERDKIIAAARRMPDSDVPVQAVLTAVTIDGRVNLRMAPSLKAPVMAKLAPASVIQVAPTASGDWFALHGQPGFVHASALQSVEHADEAGTPAPVTVAAASFIQATVGSAHLAVRERPSINGRVVARLKPGTAVQLVETAEQGWFELAQGDGFVHESGLVQALKAAYRGGSGGGVRLP
ncbi:SH3 domain-containing protein [Sinimarinibacterium flocculans]|uniref:SH3 domain-containing protein n=2 Tax=Sinimarinibacterium flocculans TaxID=985250 RepID=A0A318E837_9GAMM|nr:SH3 domain-containing protein [Sinimarinibacterium flocculans]